MTAPGTEYWALTIRLGPEATDAVTNFLSETGATGLVEEGDGASIVLRAFFPPGTDPGETRRRLIRYLADIRALAVPVGAGRVEVTPVLDEAWADAWRVHFRPIPVGRRLLVCPPWVEPDDGAREGRLLVVIEPGRAFGTGGHATTRGCLELLERALATPPTIARVLDVGTGSGILAIAAARLGAARVSALDVDPDAVAAARANAGRNGLAERVSVELGTPEAWTEPAADLVLANLLGAAHIALAPALARCTAALGRLVAGGVLISEEPAVVGAFADVGLRPLERAEHDEWVTLLFVRRTPPGGSIRVGVR